MASRDPVRCFRLVFIAVAMLCGGAFRAEAQTVPPPCPCSLWPETAVPAVADVGPDAPVELGLKFSPQVDGLVTAIRFYKSAANTGVHVGNLWSVFGTMLGSATFENETASGWQVATLPNPIAVVAGTTYVVSYHTTTGHYAYNVDYFYAALDSGPLRAINGLDSPNGVYRYGSAGTFPDISYRLSNYWVDVVFQPATGEDPAVLRTTPIAGATDASPPITAVFRSDMQGSSIVMTLRDSAGAVLPASITYSPVGRSALLTPRDPLLPRTAYSVTIESAAASDGRRLPSAYAWSFTTGASGFRETIALAGLAKPMSIEFLPNGFIFVAEKKGTILVFEGLDDPAPVQFADLTTEVHDFWDRGLMGLAVHPDFPNQPYVYVSYTHDAPIGGVAPFWGIAGVPSDPCPSPTLNGCVVSARVSRLRAAPVAGGYVMTGPEEVLIEDWGQQYPSHSIGAIMFGQDGALYATAGDGASYTSVDYGQRGDSPNPLADPPSPAGVALAPPGAEGGALRAQSLRRANGGPVLLNGTVIRVDPATGAGLPDNPRGSSADANTRRIVAHGLRNPFRGAMRPGTSEVWVGDVGWDSWEEIDRLVSPTAAIANFGWPCYEGVDRQAAYEAVGLAICQGLYAEAGAVTSPIYTYNHHDKVVPDEPCGTGSSSTTGLAFYRGGSYPPAYNNALFFADYSRKCIWAMLAGADGVPDPTRRATFRSGAATPVELKIGPGGDLFYVDLSGGTVRRISYVAFSMDPPQAHVTAAPAIGVAPLDVAFDGSGSTGGGSEGLTYSWDFGDGTTGAAGASRISHTYASGTFTARLTVRDTAGQTSTATADINVNNRPPVAVIDTPLATRTWQVGETITFTGHAIDTEEGTLAASRLTWSLVLYHCSDEVTCHVHPLQDFAGAASGSFLAPDHDYPSHLELTLLARDATGLTSTATVRLDPKTVNLAFDTIPSGLSLVVGSTASRAPFSRTVIVGSSVSIGAPTPQTRSSTAYGFSTWSDGRPISHEVVAQSSNATLVASFAPVPPVPVTLFRPTEAPDFLDAGAGDPVELGVNFRSDVAGSVLGVRFYKGASNTGPHVGSLWSPGGTRLAFVTFSNETASGWQEARFSAPVAISANTTYTVSYHTTTGHYSYSPVYFGASLDRAPLHAPISGQRPNGVFKYGPAGSYPDSGYNATNYSVDLVFSPATSVSMITYPASGATNADLSLPVQWTPVPQAQSYYLYLGSTFGAKNLVDSGETQQTSRLVNLAPGQLVFARLWTRSNSGWSFTDSSFTVGAPVPVAALITYPPDGASSADLSQPIQWTSVANVQAYYLYVGSTPGANDLVNTGECQQTSRLASLPAGQRVYARIWTKVGGAWRYKDSSFVVGSGPALAATFISPASGASNVGVPTTMQWTPIPNVQAYYLYVGSVAGAKEFVDTGEIQQTSRTVSLPPGQTVYARIWTKAGGVWRSSDRSFSVAAVSTITYPVNGAPAADLSVPIQWQPVPNAQAYYLYLGTAIGAKDLLDTGEIAQTSRLASITSGQKVYARIWTKAGGVWRSSDSSFTVGTSVPLAARLTAPVNGATGVAAQTTIQWSAVANVQAYYLYLGSAPGAKDLVNTGEVLQTSRAVSLPHGQTIYARIWTKVDGVWRFVDTTFSTAP